MRARWVAVKAVCALRAERSHLRSAREVVATALVAASRGMFFHLAYTRIFDTRGQIPRVGYPECAGSSSATRRTAESRTSRRRCGMRPRPSQPCCLTRRSWHTQRLCSSSPTSPPSCASTRSARTQRSAVSCSVAATIEPARWAFRRVLPSGWATTHTLGKCSIPGKSFSASRGTWKSSRRVLEERPAWQVLQKPSGHSGAVRQTSYLGTSIAAKIYLYRRRFAAHANSQRFACRHAGGGGSPGLRQAELWLVGLGARAVPILGARPRVGPDHPAASSGRLVQLTTPAAPAGSACHRPDPERHPGAGRSGRARRCRS